MVLDNCIHQLGFAVEKQGELAEELWVLDEGLEMDELGLPALMVSDEELGLGKVELE